MDSVGATPKMANFKFEKDFENASFGASSPYRLGWSGNMPMVDGEPIYAIAIKGNIRPLNCLKNSESKTLPAWGLKPSPLCPNLPDNVLTKRSQIL